MNQQQLKLFKQLLPGFIPLFAFILIDEIWGTQAGLIAALVIGVGELAWVWVKEKRFERFVLFDTLLLLALGGVSLILHNEIFFKLKPGLVQLILCAVLAFSAYSKVNIVALMSQRYMRNMQVDDSQMQQMRASLKLMFWIFLAHTALVFYATFYLSDAAWAFISGGLFYILFGVVFLITFMKQKRQQKKQVQQLSEEEQLPAVDESGKVLGRVPRSVCHNGSKVLHPVVHLHVFNKTGGIYLQKRPMNKLIQPGKWDTAVGGHIAFGEDLETSLKREAWEEIGLKQFSAKLLKSYVWESEVERELVYVFTTNDFQGIHLHSDEVEEGRFWTRKQIAQNLGKGVFTPNFEHEYQLLFGA
ncbi:septation protein IspZ [Mangrovibacterium diazotrophicum]|uniref:Isopentenyldiphosphate isomerase n=1 Tax=Mangrovibacterium diazotrophicum TaxID=1261403 RepID=A0A419W4V7_9BACT|nr:septation protein IspZ [Mangrovibacterium diazotrophicum]RKD90482.1 isopentenyldiphosphate isomerase [Mangrovibacterium diazotrophicum]